jgi:hypothetical protein
MTNKLLVLLAASALVGTAAAGPTAEKKKHDAVEAALAKSAGDVKDCGKTYKITYDWAAFDKMDYAKVNKTKDEQYGYEITNVGWIGHDINDLCKDKDYKEALQKIDSVVYSLTADDKNKPVKATMDGKTLHFENYVGSGTRSGGDFAKAAKAAL